MLNNKISVFEKDANQWWSENSHCALLSALTPARIAYLEGLINNSFKGKRSDIRILDVGCGGGLFAEEMASIGYSISAVDISPSSISIARNHSQKMGYTIDYQVSPAEHLPYEDAMFDIVYCCDVLEHVESIESVIYECSRVLKIDGLFFYDTINRTLVSKLLMIKLMQDWLKVVPNDLHNWNKFIKPEELKQLMTVNGLKPIEMIGLMPGIGLRQSIKRAWILSGIRKGKRTYAELSKEMQFSPTKLRLMNYMGYSVKAK